MNGFAMKKTVEHALPVAHGMTLPQLQVEYDVEKTIPNLPEYMAQFAKASEETRQRFGARVKLDQRYGEQSAERLDIYLPDAPKNAPVVIFFHGGAWKGSNKECRGFPADLVCPRGAIWISVEYPLAPEHRMEQIVDAARKAIGWVTDNIAALGGRRDRILVSGHSAGAHLATMGLFCLLAERPALKPEDFRLMTISGVFDLLPLALTKVNDWLQMLPAVARTYSPIAHIPVPGPSLTAFVGSNEPDAFLCQTNDMATSYARAGNAARVIYLPGRNHFSVLEEFGLKDSPLQQELLDFVTTAT